MKRLPGLRDFTTTVDGRKTRLQFNRLRFRHGEKVYGWAQPGQIVINPCQKEREILSTIIHEWTHNTHHHELQESVVRRHEEELVAILWDHLGYRRVLG